MMSKQLTAQAPVDPIVLGKMGSSYGIRGWLRVFSSTEDAESIFDYQPWFIQKAGQWQQVQLESWKHHNQDMIIKLKGVDDRDAANLLTNCEIVVDSSQLPQLEEGDYYWKDLMGCQVVTTEGYDLGKVVDMMETGSNDVLVIKANLKDAFGIKERLVPFFRSDRDAANLLTNCEIVVDSSQLPQLEEGDYYWKDLMGCQVVTTEGYDLGKVVDMMETGSNDVLVIKANLKDAFGIKERLVPFL